MISSVVAYFIFGLVMLAIIALLTAYYTWRARSIGRKWWKKAEQLNDSGSNEPR